MKLLRLLLPLLLCLPAAAGTKRPHILFLLADDWGIYARAYRALDGAQSPNALGKR